MEAFQLLPFKGRSEGRSDKLSHLPKKTPYSSRQSVKTCDTLFSVQYFSTVHYLLFTSETHTDTHAYKHLHTSNTLKNSKATMWPCLVPTPTKKNPPTLYKHTRTHTCFCVCIQCTNYLDLEEVFIQMLTCFLLIT